MIDLYRFFDASERLLYVGISLSAIQRANQHLAKPWWPEVARMEVEHLEVSRTEIEAIERQAIIAEKPIHNVKHNGLAATIHNLPDRLKERAMSTTSPLVGLFVLTPDETDGWPLACRQGVMEAVIGDFALVLWFSWLHGGPLWSELVRLDAMEGWRLYVDNEDMVYAANVASKARDQKVS